jgi:membrane fusion protein (multidrug efflux system)
MSDIIVFLKTLPGKINLNNLKNLKKPDFKNKEVKKKIIMILLVGIVTFIVLVRLTSNLQNVLFKKKPIAKEKGAVSFVEEAVPVKAFKIKKTEFKDTLPCIGNIRGYREIDLKFQVAGIIESFNFEEGEKIQEGDIIASLVQRDALLKLKYSEIELTKNQKLFELGAINQIKMDQAKLEYESAKSDLDKTNIYAASNGLLGSRGMDVGSYYTPNETGQKIGVFVDTVKVYAEFNIIEKDVPKVALGQKVEVFVDAYPNKSFNGVIDRIAPIIEGRSRTETIKVELDNKDGMLKPGMFTRALIATYEKKDVIVIPSSGLKKKENDYLVYLIHKEEPKQDIVKAKEKPKNSLWSWFGKKKEKEAPKPQVSTEKAPEYGTIEIRKVKLGYMTQDLVEVEDGLKEDELIVIEIQEDFKDKTKVEVSEVQEGLI